MTVEATATETPAVPEAVEAPALDGSSEAGDDYAPETDEAAAIAVLKAARAKPPTEEAPPPAAAAPVAPAPPAAVAPPKSSLDEHVAGFTQRLAAIEAERATERTSFADMKARLEKRDAAFADFRKDPEKLFAEVGWDQETVKDYLLNGPKAAKPELSAMEAKFAALEARLAQAESQAQAKEAQAQVERTKASIPAALGSTPGTYPIAEGFYENVHEFAEQVWQTMEHARTNFNRQITPTEAASMVENTLTTYAKRLQQAVGKTPPAPVAKKTVAPITNSLPTGNTAPRSADEEDHEVNFKAAEDFLRQRRLAAH